MDKRKTLWAMTRPTAAKHLVLRKYLDAWLPILGGGRYAHDDLVLIDAFAGPGRYSTGEVGSPLLMINSYLEHSGDITARPHFFFIEEDAERIRHLRGEVARLNVPTSVEIEIVHDSFDPAFPQLIAGLEARFGHLPPTFAFIDPFGAGDLPVALSSPLLNVPRCEALIYFPVGHVARFGEQSEFDPTMNNLFSGNEWRSAFAPAIDFETRKRMLLDLFMDELRKRVPYVRAFEITPMREAGGNTYHLVFGTANAEQGLRKMKDAMWRVDPSGGRRFRDTTLVEHPVLFDAAPPFAELAALLKRRFGNSWFTIEQAEEYTLLETPFRDNGHLKLPTLKPAERTGELDVRRAAGQRGGTFTRGTSMRFIP